MTGPHATPESTARYAQRIGPLHFYRQAQGLTVSTLGIGTYLGGGDEATDAGYVESITNAARRGINLIDTSLNYRHQRSERNVGTALARLFEEGTVSREEIVVCTKAGYMVPGAAPKLEPSDVAGGMHSMAPMFLADQLQRSLANLRLQCIDVFYLHNPETQLQHLTGEQFELNVRRAFVFLEEMVASGRIAYYGTATWDGYRLPPTNRSALSLIRLASLAQEIAGARHHFRFVQLPFNMGMAEAFLQRSEEGGRPENVLETAGRLGISVIASATLLQARLLRTIPESAAELFPGANTNAQRAIQFTRSTPGITSALVGMSSPAHVDENTGVSRIPPLTPEQYATLYQRA